MVILKKADLRNYRKGEILQYMKSVDSVYATYDTKALLLADRYQHFADCSNGLDGVLKNDSSHELSETLETIDNQRSKSFSGLKQHLESQLYRPEEKIALAAKTLLDNLNEYGEPIYKLNVHRRTSLIDAVVKDCTENTKLVDAVKELDLQTWIDAIKTLNVRYHTNYIERSQTPKAPVGLSRKKDVVTQAYLDLIRDTESYARVAENKEPYLKIISDLNDLTTRFNAIVDIRKSANARGKNNVSGQKMSEDASSE